ncbi:pseudaminic acid biosynthesis-associated methylase [uncultured Brevundimonas sp.]|uniref:pseudaminic acid biosynthesis-associated methylase n=1 Tax=uncultured Brevundimonas sp. TaxID=213418 RepID=UPI0030ED95DC|tara:strand:- start:17651 stop:18319 length:669 start_codon:yes stop_codon:yes gene_type:complete
MNDSAHQPPAGSDPKPLKAWAGSFGDAYTVRCAVSDGAVDGRVRVLETALAALGADRPRSLLEVGSNLGLNLRALPKVLGAEAELWAVEPNASARARVIEDHVLPANRMLEGFGHSVPLADGAVELAMTSGVLIHVDPTLLEATMREIHRVASKYILCIEYFSSTPETITYRGEEGLLFKRDFGGLYLDTFPDLELVDYGFFWKRMTVMDDSTWWLFRKTDA